MFHGKNKAKIRQKQGKKTRQNALFFLLGEERLGNWPNIWGTPKQKHSRAEEADVEYVDGEVRRSDGGRGVLRGADEAHCPIAVKK